MSTEKESGTGSSSSQGKTEPQDVSVEKREHRTTKIPKSEPAHQTSPPHLEEERRGQALASSDDERKPEARAHEIERIPDASETETKAAPRQVIAVSASKGPAAFFNLARKFLVTDEMCDLSALEGAIVSAVDAAHLLERSQLATIVRYVMELHFRLEVFMRSFR